MRDSRPLQEGGARWNATLALVWWEDGPLRAQGVGVTGGRVREGGGEGASHHKNGHTLEKVQVHGESRLPRSVTALRSQQASLTPGRLSSRTGRSRTCSEDKRAARVAVTAAAALGEVGGAAAASMMKFKPNQTRTYDREGYKKRAACLCFKNEREDEVRLGGGEACCVTATPPLGGTRDHCHMCLRGIHTTLMITGPGAAMTRQRGKLYSCL